MPSPKSTLQHEKNRSQTDEGLDAAVCAFTPGTGTLTYAGARIPLYIVANNEIRVINADRQSLGYDSSDPAYNFTSHTFNQIQHSVFYLPTDGFTDQLGGDPRTRFGSLRFKNLLLDNYLKPFDMQKNIMLNTLANQKGDLSSTDDITFVGFMLGLNPCGI